MSVISSKLRVGPIQRRISVRFWSLDTIEFRKRKRECIYNPHAQGPKGCHASLHLEPTHSYAPFCSDYAERSSSILRAAHINGHSQLSMELVENLLAIFVKTQILVDGALIETSKIAWKISLNFVVGR